MYQTFVLGLGLLLLTGLAYYIKHTDQNGLVTGSFSTTTTTVIPATPESLPGVYMCNSSSGCENPRVLKIMGNGEVTLSSSFNNGVELVEEFGTWDVNDSGTVQILLTGTNSETYTMPRTILIGTSTSDTLSQLTFDTTLYGDWKNPVFLKDK